MKFDPIVPRFPCILHGGDYNPDQWRATKEIWLEDMRLARLARINTLSVGIFAWAALEPEEGRFDFSWLDEVMDLMAENGIAAVLATPSGARPAWLSRKYPEVLRVNEDRRRILHGVRHNHCYTSPVYREKVKNINTKLAERYKDHPALAVWHISNEYGGECHCELCQEAFRKWLKKRYGSLDALNAAWWTAFWSHTYTDWSQIESPSSIGEVSVHGLTLDWKRFVTEQTADFMKAEMEPLRRLTPNVPCTANMMGLYDGLNYYRLSEEMDIASWDNYPIWRSDESDADTALLTSMVHDMNRRLKDGRPFMLMESSPSATNWQPVGKLRRPGLHELQSIQAVAHGSDTVQYFQFRKSRGSYEKFHGAVVDHVGTEHTRVFREVAGTGETLEKLDAIVGTSKPSDVAIIYDVENRWALEICQGFKHNKNYIGTLKEHYAPFWKSGISVDIIDSTKELSGYKLVIAPMLYMLRPGMAEKIEDFVKRGGTFVATYMTGYVDEHDLCFLGGFPGPLRKVLGIWCEELDSLFDEERRHVEWNGTRYEARDFCEIVHAEGAKIIGTYCEDFYASYPALTVNNFGEGEAYFVAARLDEQFQDDFFGMLIDKLGITGAIKGSLPYGCTAQMRTDGEDCFVFVMNFTPEQKSIDIGDGGKSMVSGEEIKGSITLPPWGFDIYIKRNKEE
ncbi:MAG: beta-galactosidase [Clostridiaceae bacterium]|jgi:beta-galactosidase|nr:beta-galactosidase [Bacillota bacterium]NLP07860.1 beta-galactosidase [Clostridiaceae bacterium]